MPQVLRALDSIARLKEAIAIAEAERSPAGNNPAMSSVVIRHGQPGCCSGDTNGSMVGEIAGQLRE